MKFKLIILIIPILLVFSSCRAEEDKTDTENEKETLIMAYPSEVEDYYFNSFQQSESNELIAMFNQKSEDFIIQKQEYESYDKLLMDILSGRSFDLLYVGDWLDMTSMYNKGIFCDLNELIDADDEISRDIFVEPVLDALEVNGKLYQMPCDFAVETAVVNADTWDGDPDHSIAHLCEKAQQLGYEIPFDLSPDSFSFTYIVFDEFSNIVCIGKTNSKNAVISRKAVDAYIYENGKLRTDKNPSELLPSGNDFCTDLVKSGESTQRLIFVFDSGACIKAEKVNDRFANIGGCNTAIVGMKRQNGGTGIGYSRIYEIDGSDYVYDMKGVTEFVFDENGAARGYEASDNSAVKKALKNFSEKNI